MLNYSASIMSSNFYTFDSTAPFFFSDSFLPPQPQTTSTTLQDYTPPLASSSFFSFSPPSSHLQNLNLESEYGIEDLSLLDAFNFKVKTEECQMGVDYDYDCNSKFMQRSYSSNSFDGKPAFLFQPNHNFDTLIDSSSSNFQSQALSSPENSFLSTGQVRRACSTGDLQNMISTETSPKEGSFLEEANFKVGRYSAEERKEKISKYRAKRSQRNFNKTIKYACRKTLADNRPRIRGRFARNDESGENPKVPCSARDEDEDEFWFEGLHEEQDDTSVRGEQYLKGYGGPQLQHQYYGF